MLKDFIAAVRCAVREYHRLRWVRANSQKFTAF